MNPTPPAHTPGPWINPRECCVTTASRDRLIADTRSSEDGLAEDEANARLIAAAPALLAALQEAEAAFVQYEWDSEPEATPEHRAMMARIRAALAKATA